MNARFFSRTFFLNLFFVGGVAGFALIGGFWVSLKHAPLVDFSILQHYAPGKPSVLLDCHGKEWGRFQFDKRTPVSMDVIPQVLVNAFVAAEDWKFFQHKGISFRGIIRSAVVNLLQARVVQGASTITQQLVKLLFFDTQRTFKRKIKEQILALLVEQQFTKDHILELYLNHVYFGSGVYGVEAAAQRFWAIPVKNISLAQAALLAAVVCSPGHYSPVFYPLSAQQRRNIILGKMKILGFITSEQYEQACNEPVSLVPLTTEECGLYVKETIRVELEDKVGRQALYTGGLTIQTTLDLQLQKIAEKEAVCHFERMQQLYGGDIQGAFISLDNASGGIRALVGGVDFHTSPFNRALYAKRQQGSVFKPLIYTAALLKGRSLADMAVDEPIVVEQDGQQWAPKNHHRRFDGSMTLARALSYSNNIISVKTILDVGPQLVADLAKKFRLSDPIPPYPSLSLGCVDSTLDQVAAMFSVFAHDGIYTKPFMIVWVKDSWGKKIIKHTPEQEQIIPKKVAHQIASVLMLGLERRRMHTTTWLDSQAISKTGTTNDSRTCWFVGSTPELTTAVYAGCDDNRPLGKKIFPVHIAYPLWLEFHKKVLTVKKHFMFDDTLTPMLLNWKTGKRAFSDENPEVVRILIEC